MFNGLWLWPAWSESPRESQSSFPLLPVTLTLVSVLTFSGRVRPSWFLRSENSHAVFYKALGTVRALGALQGGHVFPEAPRH